MENIKFLVKLNRNGKRAAQYVKRTDSMPVQTTADLNQALAMGKYAAEDILKAVASPSCRPELVPVKAPV